MNLFEIGERVAYWPKNKNVSIGNIKHFYLENKYFKIIDISEINKLLRYYLVQEEDNGKQIWIPDKDLVLATNKKLKNFFKLTNFKDEKIYF